MEKLKKLNIFEQQQQTTSDQQGWQNWSQYAEAYGNVSGAGGDAVAVAEVKPAKK